VCSCEMVATVFWLHEIPIESKVSLKTSDDKIAFSVAVNRRAGIASGPVSGMYITATTSIRF
jgi:hypothetical protein